jgi:hypothetical protein
MAPRLASRSGRTAPADRLGPSELAFLADRHGFYVASAGATGWPDAQHRGESPGFLRVLDNATLGWPDCAGDEHDVTTGDIAGDDWVAIVVMDDAGQRRFGATSARGCSPGTSPTRSRR